MARQSGIGESAARLAHFALRAAQSAMRFAGLFLLVAVLSFAAGSAVMKRGANPSTPRNETPVTNADVYDVPPPASRENLFEWMSVKIDPLAQAHELRAVIGALGSAELRALFEPPGCETLLARLEEVPNELKNSVFQNLLRRWLAVDESAVLAWLPEAPRYFPPKSGRVHLIIGVIAERDSEAAINFIKQLPADGFRESLAFTILGSLTKENPARARSVVARFDDDPKLHQAMESGYQRALLATNPAAEVTALQATPNAERKTNVTSIIMNLGEQTPAAILELCRVLETPENRRLALSKMAEWNPAGAAQVAEQVLAAFRGEPLAARQMYVGSAAFALARVSEAQATAWAFSLPEELRPRALEQLAAGLADADPSAGTRYFEKLLRADPRKGFARSEVEARARLFEEWRQADAASAQAWADSLPLGELRDAVQASLLKYMAYRGAGLEALRRAVALPPALAKSAALTAARALYGAEAADAAVEFGLAARTLEPLQIIVESWFSDDPPRAAAWVERLPAGAARDAAAATCAQLAMSVDAEAATGWVAQIGDVVRRTEAAKRIAMEWKKRDVLAAEAWLASISEE